MGTINTLTPYNYGAPLTDKLLGDAFTVVKSVYDNMEYVQAVGAALLLSTVGTPLLVQRAVVEQGTSGNAGVTVVIPFTDLDVDYTKILSSSAMITGASGDQYYGDSGYFTAKVTSAGLSLTMAGGAPSEVTAKPVQWFFIYEVDV